MNDKPTKTQKPVRTTPARTPKKDGDAGAVRQGERIAKRLARAGMASRRDAEGMIAAGRVKLNGKVLTSPAVNVGADDRIEVDGAPLPPIERTRLFLFHKPSGIVTTNRDPEGRRTVFDVLPKDLPRLITIGRLDLNTEGLLLLTNDGGLARVLELPSTGWLRRYRVRVHGQVDAAMLEGLKDGIAVDGVFYGAVEASLDRVQGTNAWLTIGLREGKNREIRNILGALQLDVTRLIRVSYGPFQLGDMPTGDVREIRGRTLRDQLGERLIAEAGANFDAPVAKPFSQKAEAAAAVEKKSAGAAGQERTGRERAGGGRKSTSGGDRSADRGGAKPAGKRPFKREEGREAVLGRLQTKPGRAPARGGDGPKTDETTGRRTANVWRAPGARPSGRKTSTEADKAGGSGNDRQRSGGRGSATGAPSKKDPNRSFRTRRPSGDTPRGGGKGKGRGDGNKR